MTGENQNIHIQQVLLELSRTQGAIVQGQESLAKDIRKNDERNNEQMEAFKKEVNDRLSKIEEQFDEEKPNTMKSQLKGLLDKAKYWKWALCIVIGTCMLIASVIEFGNELASFLKSISTMKGNKP